ncbi:mucin-2-like [Eriocheir sinensis]|uniref:mucin-2-like n=1 Tax=Eriocheir sinensis TaxID=95602 RepID=UPI0021CA0681|nr:mucin-2-like [Eriocheir sinensis]
MTQTPPATPKVTQTPPATPKMTQTPPATPEVTQTPPATPKVTQTPPATPKMSQTPPTNLKKTPTPPATPKGTPVSPAPLPVGETTVDATCMMMKISQDTVTLVVRSRFLPGKCGTVYARLCDIYDNGTPLTQTEAEKVRGKVWHCQLEIKNNGKQLMVPLAWRGLKPVNDASSRSTASQQPRQALSTGDLTGSSSRPSGTAAFVPQTPPSSPPKVLRGEVAEVLAKGGLLKGNDGCVYLFPLDVCFLFGVCLHQVEPSEVLRVGMTVEFEVSEGRRRRRSNEVVAAAVQRVWVEGEDASLAFPPTDSMIESWCSDNGVSSATLDALKQEAELLSPSLFPTALKMEATTTVTITS